MTSQEGVIQNLQCPIENCGRKFEDNEKMIIHIERRHPDQQQFHIQRLKEKSETNSSQISNTNPLRKRSLSRDNIGLQQNEQQQGVKKENNNAGSKERNDSMSSSSSFSQQISTERSLSKEVISSRLSQRPPTPKQGIPIKPSVIQSDSLRRSQDLFRKTQENSQLIEKTGLSSSKEPVSRQSSAVNPNTKSIQQPITLKQSKPILKQSAPSTVNDLKSPSNNSKQSDGQSEGLKKQPSSVDQDLIKSILLTISKAENKESTKNQILESTFPQAEVQSEGENDSEDAASVQNSQNGYSRPSTANKQINSSEQLKKGSTSQLNDSGSLVGQDDTKKQKQVSIQEILGCKKKITCEYLLQHSSNSTYDIGFIESLTLNDQNLIVFEDGLTDVKFDLMVSLQYLSLSKNQLINIVSLNKFSSSLLELNINFNQISDINPLYECTNLIKLWASHNLITSITCLKKLKNLKVLSLFNNQITSYIDTIKELQHLEELDLSDNPCSKDQYYKYDVLSVVKQNKLTKLDSNVITVQDYSLSKTLSNNKSQGSNNQVQNRPGSAPLKINPRTGLSASMIVNNQIKERQQNEQEQKKKANKDKALENLENYGKEKTIISNEEYQKSQKIVELEKKLAEFQSRQQDLKDQIRSTKKINKSLQSDIEEKEKENILLREQSGQIEQMRQGNKTLLKKITAYESTIILHQETPEELKNYLKSLASQVKALEEKNQLLNEDNEKLEQDFMNEEEGSDYDSDNSDYNPEKINELLRRSTAAFSLIKQDLKQLQNVKK